MRDSLPPGLKPHEANLYRVVREGLDLFQQRYSHQRAVMSVTSERNNIHDCMVEMAQKVFPSHQWKRRGLLFMLVLGDYRIKLKKFNSSLVTSSYPTQAVFEFLSQAVRKLFDMDVENLQVGYIPSGLTVADYSIWIAKPKASGRPEWEYELRADSVGAVLPTLPVTDPNAGRLTTRVKAKPAKFKKGEGNKGE